MKNESYESPELFKHEDSTKWTGGFLLLMGLIFFAGMSHISIFGVSAWVLVALLPVYWIGVYAYKRYQEDGYASRRVFSILVWGLLPFAFIAAVFMGFNAGALWPIGLIAVGVAYIIYGTGK